jgi:hypothetical protein
MGNRFSDQLEKIIRGAGRPMGFGQNAAAVKPRLFIMAEATVIDEGAGLPGIDAVLVPGPCNCKAEKSGVLRGCAIGGEQEHSGCDFVVVSLDGAVGADIGEDTARLLRIEAGLTDAQLRAIGGLEPAAVIAEAGLGESLTFRDLLAVQRLTDFCGKPLILRLPKLYSKVELQSLSDRGITGVIVDPAAVNTTALRETVDSLEAKKRGKDKSSAILHCPPAAAPSAEEEPEIETDEDE